MNKEELPINGTYARNVLLERMLYGPAKNPRRMRKNDPAGIFKIYASDYSTSAPFTSTVYPSGVSQIPMRVPLKPSPSSWK